MEIDSYADAYVGVTTQQVVQQMLRENTGSHFLDSGGAYGRNWQHNQGHDFSADPPTSVEWSVWRRPGMTFGQPDPSPTVSLYHWMMDCLEFDPALQARLDELADANNDRNWLALLHDFAESFGDVDVVNTYNYGDRCHLSQVLQYATLRVDDQDVTHLVVSVHGGCDVRGGYTAPKCFKLTCDYDEACLRMSLDSLALADGSQVWSYPSGLHGDADPMHLTDLACNPLKLPCYGSDDFDDHPTIVEIDQHLARIERDYELIGQSTLCADLISSSRNYLDTFRLITRKERFAAVCNLAAQEHDEVTVVCDKRLYYVTSCGEYVQEIAAYSPR